MILPALSAGLTSDNPAVTLGSPLVKSGICLPVMCRPIGASAWTPAADPARNLSDAVSVEVVTLGQDRDPEFRL